MLNKCAQFLIGSSCGVLFFAQFVCAGEVHVFKIGDRVDDNGQLGTVIGIGPPIFSGGNMINVHLDKFGPANPKSAVLLDPVNSPFVKPAAPDAPSAPGADSSTSESSNSLQSGSNASSRSEQAIQSSTKTSGSTTITGANAAGVDVQVPPNAPPNAETFKNVLRARIPQPGWGDTIRLEFLRFNLSGPMTHSVRYEGHLNQQTILGGPGRGVKAWKANTQFIQHTHFKDVNADDQQFTKTGDYWFYKDPSGYWVSEDENVQLGHVQYIKKN